MIDLSFIRETCLYKTACDEILISHDIRYGNTQTTLRYKSSVRKLKNPLTIKRYRERSQRLLYEAMRKRGVDNKDLEKLPIIKGYELPEWVGLISV